MLLSWAGIDDLLVCLPFATVDIRIALSEELYVQILSHYLILAMFLFLLDRPRLCCCLSLDVFRLFCLRCFTHTVL
jgi:hypothetical protein